MIAQDIKSTEIIKPLLRGRDIKRYDSIFSEKWIITTFPAMKLNINIYDAIKNHLQSFGTTIEQTGEKGSRKKTSNKWFETQDSISYYQEFDKEKIIFSKASKEQAFTYTNETIYLQNTCYIMTGKSLRFLVSILNSKLAKYIFLNFLQSGGINGEITLQAIEKLPIPKISEEQQKPFINLVNEILEAKQKIKEYKILLDEAIKNDNFDREIKLKKELETLENLCASNEKAINEMVYKLYGLSEDEIKIVEGV